MNDIRVGISAHRSLPKHILDASDYIEIKKITVDEVSFFQGMLKKPLFFHIQYTHDDRFYLPTAMNFEEYMSEISAAYEKGFPELTSLHFGISAWSKEDTEHYMAIAESKPFKKHEIVNNLEKNLKILKSVFPGGKLLVENSEFIPEALSFGAYRYISETNL
jgi:hypothetical protein